MARFHKGQRVKLVRPFYPENMGLEGTFLRYEFNRKGSLTVDGFSKEDTDCIVLYDVDKNPNGSITNSSRLEPITDSYDLASWDTCIWKPEHLRVKA